MREKPSDLSDRPDAQTLVRDGLRCLQLSGALFLRSFLTAPWSYLSPPSEHLVQMLKPGDRRVILFHVFTEGRCRLELERGGSEEFVAGDIAIMPFADQHRVGDPEIVDPVPIGQILPPPPWSTFNVLRYGGGGTTTGMLCGYLYCDDLPFNPVLASLPPLIRLRTGDGPLATWVRASIDYALHASGERPGAGDASLLQRLPELLFTECLCEFAAQHDEHTRGWLAGLTDPIVGRALAVMHRSPEESWTLAELAKRAATSRSVLDDRFRRLVGQAPLSYLTAWRLQLASRQLRTTNATMAEVAGAVGYGSEASFSKAFKRHTGVSPSEWRQATS
jgi:AraC-like DNA-binding protein